jgi:hypothetical protein
MSVLVILLLIHAFYLHKKFKSLFVGDAKNIPESFKETKKNLDDLRLFEKEILYRLDRIDTRIEKSVKKVHMTRFTPFTGIGSNGNQSFSLSLLDEKGDGVLLSGLYYGQDRVSLFAKPIEAFISKIYITPEETEVLASSKKN